MSRTWPLTVGVCLAVTIAASIATASAADAAPASPGATQTTTSPNWSGWADVARPGAAMRSGRTATGCH
jgi:hypothetical protein